MSHREGQGCATSELFPHTGFGLPAPDRSAHALELTAQLEQAPRRCDDEGEPDLDVQAVLERRLDLPLRTAAIPGDARRVLIVADPLGMVGLKPGDAKILRNAGARVTDDVGRRFVFNTPIAAVMELVNEAYRVKDDLYGDAEGSQRMISRYAMLAREDIKATLGKMGATPDWGTPQQFSDFVQAETTKFAEIIKREGLQMDVN